MLSVYFTQRCLLVAFFLFLFSSCGHSCHLNDGACLGSSVRVSCCSLYQKKNVLQEVTDVDCFAAKTTNHCPRILSQRRFDIVTLFMFHGQKMAASSLLLKKKKMAKVSALVPLRTNQGVFSARAVLDATFFLRFLTSTFRPCNYCSAVSRVLVSCKKHAFL